MDVEDLSAALQQPGSYTAFLADLADAVDPAASERQQDAAIERMLAYDAEAALAHAAGLTRALVRRVGVARGEAARQELMASIRAGMARAADEIG